MSSTDTARFTDQFICSYPGPHGDGAWCTHHNVCHGVGIEDACQWTAECRPRLPTLTLVLPTQAGYSARVVGLACRAHEVRVGDLVGLGLRVVEITESGIVVESAGSERHTIPEGQTIEVGGGAGAM